MPARVIRSEINSSDSLARVSPEADLTFRALIVAVDDYGRMDARPHILKAELFPLRDAFTPDRVAEFVRELAALPSAPIRLYEHDGRPYLHLTAWERYRGNSHRSKKSKYPQPPVDVVDFRNVPEDSGISGCVPENPPGSRESGVGRRETRDESGALASGTSGNAHPLTDATRTDLDANPHAPPPDPAPTPHRPLPQPDHAALTAACEVLDHWRDLRAADVPTDRTAQPDAWPLRRNPLAMRLVPRVQERGKRALIAALDYGWRDRGDGARWSGWRSKLSTPERALTALASSELVDQAASAATAQAEGAKREAGNGRRNGGPEPPDYAAITRDREAYERKMREEFEREERVKAAPRKRGGDPVPIGAVLKEVLR